jgi:hypothetical protein
MLHFIKDQIWKNLFGRVADGIERSVEDENEYRILDKSSITNRFVSLSSPNCSAFVAGIVEGILVSCKMDCKVIINEVPSLPQPISQQALSTSTQDINAQFSNKSTVTTVYRIKFTEETMERKVN